MKTLYIDPAIKKLQAWAFFKDQNVFRWGSGDLAELDDLMPYCDCVYCEGQYVGKNARDALALSRVVGRIEEKADKAGKGPINLIAPKDWMRAILGNLLKNPLKRTQSRARAIRTVAVALARQAGFKEPILITDDESEAICGGIYAARLFRPTKEEPK